MSKYSCPFSMECPAYKGEEEAGNIPLFLFKNVFCHRGVQGWNNCERYFSFLFKDELVLSGQSSAEKILHLNEIEKREEKEILLLLHREGKCSYKDILKEINCSVAKGADHLSALLSKGYIKTAGNLSVFELNINIQK